jgi:DNA repair exonuclease SbcCD ATPase subunit
MFTTIDTQLTGITNKVGVFGKSLNNIFRDFQSGQGFKNSLFGKGMTSNDIGYITDFMKQIEAGVPTGQAWAATMKNASVAGKQMAVQVKSGAVSLEQLQTSANTSKAAMIGLRVATVALNMALSMGIAFAIQAAVTGLNNFVHAAKNASEAADDLSQKSREHITELEDEKNSIEELIQKYVELKNSDTQDSSTRSEIAEIQSSITSLVGEQAGNLDLVNGKLDTELGKLKDIQSQIAKDNLQDAVANYKNAKESSKSAIGEDSYLMFDGYAYTGKREKNLEKILEDAGYGGNVQSGGIFGNTLFVMDEFDNDYKKLENAAEKAKYLKGMIDTIENSGENYADSSLYAGLKDQYNAYMEYVDNQHEAASKLLEFAADYLQYDDKLSAMTVDSADSLEKYRDTMVDSIMDLPQLEAAIADGSIDKDFVQSYVDTWLSTIDKYSDYYNELENESSTAASIIEEANSRITESITQASETTTNLISGITSAQSALSGQKNGQSISIADFNSDELKDYQSALEYVNGTMQLNSEKVKEIAQAKADEQVAINNTNKALEQAKYLENAKQIEQYRQKLRDANFAEGESQQSVQASIDALLTENSAIADTCKQYDLLSTSIQEAVGAYQNWLNAQSGSDYGDMASDAVSAIQRIRDTYDSNSDVYGDFGSKKFEAAIDFIVPDSVDGDDLSAIESYMSDFKQYLKFDDNGTVDGLDIDKFLENSVNAGLMKYSEDDGFQVLGGKKMEDFAEGLNMSSGMVQAFFDELQLKGADFDWGDEAVKTMGDLAVEANEAAESLRSVDQFKDLKIKTDVSDLSTTEEQVSALDATIAEMEKVKSINLDDSSVENANSVIQYCLSQKQLLTQPDVMRVDTSQVEGDIGKALSLLQEFQNAQNDLEIKAAVGADTSEAESKVNSLAEEIQGMSSTYISCGLEIDTTSVESIQSSIPELTAEMIVNAGVDDSAVAGYNPDSKTCDVIYDPKTDALPESFDAINRDVNYVPHTGNLPESFTTLTRYVNYVKTGAVDVNGTAHVSGTAKAGGDWGTAPGGKTLVGELGREIVVDPHTGRWYTVGDNGAEFRDIPAGAIVFNHVQSESLLENGYVAGRAAALVSGTALVTGGYKPYKPSSSPSTKKSSSKSSSSSSGSSSSRSSSGSSSSKSSSSSSSSSSEKDFEETFDWIEIAIKRISEAIDRVKVKAESAFKTLAKRNSAAADEISLITQQINTQNQAYTRYMQQANSVGLSSDWMDKVKNGTIDISTITDEDLSDKIKDFQDFYEKAIEAKDAVADLHEEIAKLYADRFSNISTDFDNQLALVQHLTDTYNTGLDTLEAKGLKGSKVYYQALQKAEKENQAILQKELVDLTESFNQAMASGEIEKGSEQWYEMQKSINDVKEAIDESNLSLLEYQKTMRELDWEYFDYMEDRISNITDEADFLIDLMANGKLFDDKGQMTDTGMATMGLHGQNYNVDMAQADQYAKAIKELNAEIAKDPYNTDLIERRQELLELQRKSILAAEDEKQAMIDLVKDGIEAQLDSLKDLIDAYTDSLDSAKDLYDYQKKVKEQSDEIASLQKQLSAYAGDNSEETKATIQKIQVDLSKAMEELQETEYDRYITDQKKLLDDLYNEYELSLNARLDNVDAFLSDMIDSINANSSSISDTIQQECANVGYTLSETMNSIWTNDGGAFTVISKYGDQFLTQNTSTLNAILGIKAYTDALIAKADAEAKAKAEATKKQTEASKPASQPSKPSNNTPSTPSKPARTDKDYYGVALAIWNGNYGWGTGNTRVSRLQAKGFDANRVQSIVNQMGREGYVRSGAWVGRYQGIRDLSPYHYNKYAVGLKNAAKAENAWVNELGSESIVKPSENAIVTHIAKGDSVLTADATRNIWDMASDPSGFISGNLFNNGILSGLEPYMRVNNNSIGEVTFNLPNVTNYEEFMNRAKKDEKFEDMIQAMTIGIVAGKSTLAKNKYKW